MKKTVSVVLAMALFLQGMTITSFAGQFPEPVEPYAVQGIKPEPVESYAMQGIKPQPVLREFADMPLGAYEALPEKYFPKEDLSPVKDQGDLGYCWAYATASAMEDSVYRTLGKKLTGDALFDPLFFADVVDNGRPDPLGLTKGDEFRKLYALEAFSTELLVAKLSGGLGPVSYKQTAERGVGSLGYGDSDYRAKNIYYIDTKDVYSIKRAVMKYGAAILPIYANQLLSDLVSDNGVLEYTGNKYLYMPFDGERKVNHFVEIVGWDDTISADNFRYTDGEAEYRCAYDGGFIVKNSWGAEVDIIDADIADKLRIYMGFEPTGEELVCEKGDDGYYYVSYYDQSVKNVDGQCTVCEMTEADREENLYMYDGAGSLDEKDTKICANRFTAMSPAGKGGEELKYATVGVSTPGKYTLSVYSCEDPEKKPWEQTLVGSRDFTAPASGFHNVEFDKGISFVKGESFALVLKRTNGAEFKVIADNCTYKIRYDFFNYTEEGESWFDDEEYLDIKGITPSIRAVTKDCEVSISRSKTLLSKAKIKTIPDQVYKGEEVTLSKKDLLVYKGDILLSPGIDYDVEYKKNKAVGKASVTVKPKTGDDTEVTASFFIVKDPENPLVGKDRYCIMSKESLDLSALYPDAAFEMEKCREAKLTGSTVTGKKSGMTTVTALYPDGTKKDIGIVVEKPKAEKVRAESTKELSIRNFYSSLGYIYPSSVTSSNPGVAEVTENMRIKPVSGGSTKLTIMFGNKKVTSRLKVKL